MPVLHVRRWSAKTQWDLAITQGSASLFAAAGRVTDRNAEFIPGREVERDA